MDLQSKHGFQDAIWDANRLKQKTVPSKLVDIGRKAVGYMLRQQSIGGNAIGYQAAFDFLEYCVSEGRRIS
jgi:hypothetical protein